MTDATLDVDGVTDAIRSRLDGVVVIEASAETGAPVVAWGDRFLYAVSQVDGDGGASGMPFATIVTSDYPDFDELSRLDRPGVFRLNVHVPHEVFEQLFPAWSDERDIDFSALDLIVPHPVYWRQNWIAVLCPSSERLDEVQPWLSAAHERAMRST